MSSNTFRVRQLSSVNNENPMKNIKNNLITNRKQTALKLLTNTVQTAKKLDGNGVKPLKVLPMKNFETEIKCKSPLQLTAYSENDEFNHYNCSTLEKDCLPPSMTCNIGMLSNFFSTKDDDESDWFLEDFKNIMEDKVKNTFEKFGEPDEDNSYLSSLPPLPVLDFPEISF